MEQKIEGLIAGLKRRNIEGIYVESRQEAGVKIEQFIPKSSSVGISGSKTLDEIGIVARLEASGYKVFNQYKPGISRQQSMQMRNLGCRADCFLTSCNAISEKGEIVFFSGYGHRTSGISNADNLVVVCGVNKITSSLDQALKRSREHATVLNCKRLDWKSACLQDGTCRKDICLAPEYKRMCCQILVIESEVNPGRMKVIIVGESLGF
ncbi:MAG: lactate utilization protein [Candidatus Omnitrophica bacterium]|nr:lactate utilization protein [Candidatus Omnitrophota bacterium]MDD5771693.1 lactate utilization protein [Candidatus Omnitrophota bacterium]